MAECVMCREPIKDGARICTACSSYQGWWRRNLANIGFAAGAIAALLPLFSAADSLRQIVLERHKADIRVRAASCRTSGIDLAISNLGQGAGLIGDVKLDVTGASEGGIPGLTLRHTPAEVVVKPLDIAPIALTGFLQDSEQLLPWRVAGQSCTYHLTVSVEDAERHSEGIAECDCPPKP